MIIEEHLTVRDIESLVKKEKKKNEINRKSISSDLQTELNLFRDSFNQNHLLKEPVKITSNKIVITVHNVEEIKKIRDMINGKIK
jgi:hypothetical protein